MRPMPLAIALALLLPAAASAGCLSPRSPLPASFDMIATWQAWEGDPLLHLILQISNAGGATGAVGPGAAEVSVAGPGGTVPVLWGDGHGPREVLPGQSATLVLHPRAAAGGGFELTLDHAAGTPEAPPSGEYTVCVGTTCMRNGVA